MDWSNPKRNQDKPSWNPVRPRQGWQETPEETAQFKTGSAASNYSVCFLSVSNPHHKLSAAVSMFKHVRITLDSEAEFSVTWWKEVDRWCLALGLLHTQMFGFILQQFQEETGSRRGRNFRPAYKLTYLESSLSYIFLSSLLSRNSSVSHSFFWWISLISWWG